MKILRLGFNLIFLANMLIFNIVYANSLEEQRFQSLTHEFRCLVCQNQSLSESNSSFAIDLKQDILNNIRRGQSDSEIRQYLLARYGDFILLKPPVKALTLLLWGGPLIMLIGGLLIFLKRVKVK